MPPETMFPPPLATQLRVNVVSVGGIAGPILKFVTVQVSVFGLPAGAGGSVVLEVTVTEVEDVQPVVELVINKVYTPGAFTVGVRVFWPDTKLPPTVVQLILKLGAAEDVEASSTVCVTTQFNCAGGAMTVTGGGNCTIFTLVLVAQKVVPLTVTV